MSNFFEKTVIALFSVPVALVFVYIVSLYSMLSYGYVIDIMWGWFIPSELISYRPDFWQIVGLSFIARIFLVSNKGNVKKSEYLLDDCIDSNKYQLNSITSGIISPWVALLMGWVIHCRFFFF